MIHLSNYLKQWNMHISKILSISQVITLNVSKIVQSILPQFGMGIYWKVEQFMALSTTNKFH